MHDFYSLDILFIYLEQYIKIGEDDDGWQRLIPKDGGWSAEEGGAEEEAKKKEIY